MVGTFGRGAYILDDYSALRELTPQALTEEARLLPLRDAYLFEELGQQQAAWGNVTTPNPPVGAVFTYAVGQAPEGDAKLVMTIADDAGRQVRRLEVPKTTGLNRATWNLRGDPPQRRGPRRGGRGRGGGGGGGRTQRRCRRRRRQPQALRASEVAAGRRRAVGGTGAGPGDAVSGQGQRRTAGRGRPGPLSATLGRPRRDQPLGALRFR